ncbi:MAG: hypothetical protein HYT70_04650 [Candidatus Aenigmarchaeota archaeon]|nr:hypothetical protein [Candidatus Aenigmarchaeota archaeon]
MSAGDRFKQITKEIGLLRSDLQEVKSQLKNLTSLDVEIYEVRPDYIRKIKKIEKGRHFSREEFERKLE